MHQKRANRYETKDPGLLRAKEIAGSWAALAAFFGVTQQRVGQWSAMPVESKRGPQRNFVAEFCSHYGADPREIRPDVYGWLPEQRAA